VLYYIYAHTYNIIVLSYTLYVLYRLHTHIIIYDVFTRRGINRVIGLRKFIQSSTVDLCGPLGAKMFFFLFLLLQKKTLLRREWRKK